MEFKHRLHIDFNVDADMELFHLNPFELDLFGELFRFSLTSFNQQEIDQQHLFETPLYGFSLKNKIVLLKGFRQINLARTLKLSKIPVIALRFSDNPIQSAWRWIIRNLEKGRYTEIELIHGLSKMSEYFEYPSNQFLQMAETVLPGYKISDYLHIGKLPKPFLKRLSQNHVTLKKAYFLTRFDARIRRRFFTLFILLSQTSVNQLHKITDYLLDLSYAGREQIIELLNRDSVKEIFLNDRIPYKLKSKYLQEYLREIRFPTIVKTEKKFNEKIQKFTSDKRLKLSPPPGFEGTYIELTTRLDKNFSIQSLCSLLKQHANDFEELFDLLNEID